MKRSEQLQQQYPNQYVSYDKAINDFSPLRSVREAGILSLNPPHQGDIKNDNRYKQLKKDILNSYPYQQQLLALQMNRLAALKPPNAVNKMIFDYSGSGKNHGFDPQKKDIYINTNTGGEDTTKSNPTKALNHEGYHALSFLDNKNYQNILDNMKNKNLDKTDWNTVKSVIDPKFNFMNGYLLPNYQNATNQDNILADEFGGYAIENADNPLAFKPGQDNIKPFLSNLVQDIQKIYKGYDENSKYPQVHSTYSDLLQKINQSHDSKPITVSTSDRDTKKREHYQKMRNQNQQFQNQKQHLQIYDDPNKQMMDLNQFQQQKSPQQQQIYQPKQFNDQFFQNQKLQTNLQQLNSQQQQQQQSGQIQPLWTFKSQRPTKQNQLQNPLQPIKSPTNQQQQGGQPPIPQQVPGFQQQQQNQNQQFAHGGRVTNPILQLMRSPKQQNSSPLLDLMRGL